MSNDDDLDVERLELALAIKHDVAKAIAWHSANLPPLSTDSDASEEQVRAWRLDLLGRGPGQAVWERWARLIERWPGEWAPELHAIAGELDRLAHLADRVRARELAGDRGVHVVIAQTQQRVRRAASDLVRRLRR